MDRLSADAEGLNLRPVRFPGWEPLSTVALEVADEIEAPNGFVARRMLSNPYSRDSALMLDFHMTTFGFDDSESNMIEAGIRTELDFWLSDKIDDTAYPVSEDATRLSMDLLASTLTSIVEDTGGILVPTE